MYEANIENEKNTFFDFSDKKSKSVLFESSENVLLLQGER